MERLARLAAQLEPHDDGTSTSCGLGRHPTSAAAQCAQGGPAASPTNAATTWHQQCFNFEPGRMLLDQVAIITGAGGGIGKAVSFRHCCVGQHSMG